MRTRTGLRAQPPLGYRPTLAAILRTSSSDNGGLHLPRLVSSSAASMAAALKPSLRSFPASLVRRELRAPSGNVPSLWPCSADFSAVGVSRSRTQAGANVGAHAAGELASSHV